MAFGWVLDPSSSQIDLNDGTTYTLIEHSCPPGDVTPAYSSSQAMEGERVAGLHYANRKIQLRLAVEGSSQSDLEDKINDLQAKSGKVNRDSVVGGTGYGGTLKYTSPAGTSVTFDVATMRVDAEMGFTYVHSTTTNVTLDFECAPFGYGSEQTLSDHVETTAPCLVFTEASIPGDVPALGRLVVDEDQGADQNWAVWGMRSKTYSSDTTAGLYYDAYGRTPQGSGAATSTAASGYSGSGSVLANSLSSTFESILSTKANGGAHLTHTGAYRVFARWYAPTGNSGTVGVALEWATGDFRSPTRNSTVYLTADRTTATFDVRGYWMLVDHGVVRLPAGTTQWEGRFLAQSTTTTLNDDVHIDHFFLVPIDEGYGQAAGVGVQPAATAYTARDNFSAGSYSGDLASDTLPTGGTWTSPSSPYETTDFTVAAGFATRTATSDTSTDARYGRWMYASGTSAMTNQAVSLTGLSYVAGATGGIVARAVDKDNLIVMRSGRTSGGYASVVVEKFVAGTRTELVSWTGSTVVPFVTTDMRFVVYSNGRWEAQATSQYNGSTYLQWEGIESDFATGGALDDGYAGILDWNTTATATTRSYDKFYVWVPVADAACFASRSLRVKNDGVARQDTGGSYWSTVSDYRGDYLMVPASGKESRTVEFIVKMCRTNPYVWADGYMDDLSAKLYVTPRFLQLPT